MKTLIGYFNKEGKKKTYGYSTLLFLFIILFSFSISIKADSLSLSQADSSIGKEENAPSIANMKKTGAVMTEAVKEMKEKQAREEMLGYVIMIVGFGSVIFLAWFLTVQARKMQEKKDAKKRLFLEAKVANQVKSGNKNAHDRRGARR